MPGMRMELGMCQAMEQRLEQRTVIDPHDNDDGWMRTKAEEIIISEYKIIDELKKLIHEGEFIDRDNFDLEINRTVFGHPLEARLGKFARNISQIMEFYNSNEKTAEELISLLIAQKEENEEGEEKIDLPGKIASSWNKILENKYFKEESKHKNLVRFIRTLDENNSDISSGLSLLSKTSELKNQKELVHGSFNIIQQYSKKDNRLIPFTYNVLAPIIRSLKKRNERISTFDTSILYGRVVETLYMLDKELSISGTIEKIAQKVKESGILALLEETSIPLPIKVSLEALELGESARFEFLKMCKENTFIEGREIQRNIYKGLCALEELNDGSEIIEHISYKVSNSKKLAKVMTAINLVSNDPEFKYPFKLEDDEKIIKNLRFQLQDKSLARLKLDEITIDKYLNLLESQDEKRKDKFERVSKIITTLAGYTHYNQDEERISLLREIINHEIDGDFNKWRYSHEHADEQLKVLKDQQRNWKENIEIKRLIGEINALDSHIDSVKENVGELLELYEEHYSENLEDTKENELEELIKYNEEKLRTNSNKKENKQLGYQTSLLREQSKYLKLLKGIKKLDVGNYNVTLELATEITKKRSKNPLYDSAKHIREILDSEEYRDMRQIIIKETDNIEDLLKMGEYPYPHCQNWKVNSKLNRTLLSFVADANKKLYHIINGDNKAISMSVVRLVTDSQSNPGLFVENVYANEWSEDYGVAFLGALTEKASSIYRGGDDFISIISPNHKIISAMKKFSEKYKVELSEERLYLEDIPSKNPDEYWDFANGGIKKQREGISVSVSVLRIGEE